MYHVGLINYGNKEIEEFEKAEIIVKTVRLKEKNTKRRYFISKFQIRGDCK